MPEIFEADLNDVGGRYSIVVARFNDFITANLLSGAIHTLADHGVDIEADVRIVWVPGAFELPYMAKKLAESKRFKPDAVIALGCVIRGGTPHFEYVSSAATVGLEAVARECNLPVAFGVLTTDDVEQAKIRSSSEPPVPSEPFSKPAPGNKGVEAALTALEMVSIMRALS